ncbi:PREDICTED: small proline-rich protein 2H-like [Ipomoea nil]|uniref:small proline-rich protein 2H-like n=1 Tax=Ipomoea nil TaxID=35883 RepID=UPI000901ED65|nr:PREDICTED: small proline-rich protein 2H-like [Ipomoea nil]
MSQLVLWFFLLVLLICTCTATGKPQEHVHADETACKDCTICQYPYCINNQPVLPPPLPPSLPLPPPPPLYPVNCQPPPAAPVDCCPAQNMGPPPPGAPADCCPQNLGAPPPPIYYTYPERSAASEPPLMEPRTSLFSWFVGSFPILMTLVFQGA